jgi:hypothetical protein
VTVRGEVNLLLRKFRRFLVALRAVSYLCME